MPPGHYVDAAVQTLIEGLAHDTAAVPHALVPPTDTTTPPDDNMAMGMDKLPLSTDAFGSLARTGMNMHGFASPTLLLKRKKRPPMVARISMPASVFDEVKFDVENPASPPPTETLLSPLPEANRLHAGHTPIIPRALSPLPREESESGTPIGDVDEALSGPLFLPPQPGDGAEDTIPLNVLDAQLEKLRLEQEHMDMKNTPPPPPKEEDTFSPPNTNVPEADPLQPVPSSSAVVEPSDFPIQSTSAPRSRHNSGETRRSSADDVDGVILKPPRMNMGAPLGQA